jgi:putative copper export protein
MRLRRSWNVAVVLVAISLMVTLQVAGGVETSAALSELASGPVPNTAALDAGGGAGEWSAFVALVFLVVANLVALARRQPSRRADVPPDSTPWERLVAARY